MSGRFADFDKERDISRSWMLPAAKPWLRDEEVQKDIADIGVPACLQCRKIRSYIRSYDDGPGAAISRWSWFGASSQSVAILIIDIMAKTIYNLAFPPKP
jgi:hypothetical protein